MHPCLLEVLACPACGAAPLRLDAEVSAGDEIREGRLGCPSCDRTFPITRGVPRFVGAAEDYCSNFGFQWRRWGRVQVDRLAGHRLSEERFFYEAPWDRDWLKDRWILDAGCGAGRFADVAAGYGAHVVAVDLSDAVDACHENTRVHEGRVHVIQASLYDLPLQGGFFDGLYCFGVIQHTPDPRRTMETLPFLVRPGGFLAYDFYQKSPYVRPWVPRYFLRRFTPSWPSGRTLALAHVLTALFFPVGAVLQRIPLVGSVIVPLLPIATIGHRGQLTLAQEYRWTVLDTFDWYGPHYELRQHHREVARLLARLGLEEIVAEPGIVSAHVPETGLRRLPS